MCRIGRVAPTILALNMQGIAQGRVVFEGPVFSKNLGTNRMVRVYLPPSYERELYRRGYSGIAPPISAG